MLSIAKEPIYGKEEEEEGTQPAHLSLFAYTLHDLTVSLFPFITRGGTLLIWKENLFTLEQLPSYETRRRRSIEIHVVRADQRY